MVYYWAIPVAAVFFLLTVPFPLRFQAYFNTRQKRVYYSIVLFHLVYVYSGYIRLVNGKLLETNFHGKSNFLDSTGGKKMPMPDLFRHATFTKFNVFCEVGKTGDAFYPVMMSGFLRAAIGAIFAAVREKNKVIDLNNYVVTKTDKDTFEISVDSILRASLISLAYSIIKDFIHLRFMTKQGEKKHV